MPNRFFTAFFAAAVVALAAIAPIASASTRALACQESPAYWISVTDEQGVPGLELVGATTCTAAVDTSDLCASQRSPYPGWVQVTDEIGRDPADAGGSGRACRDVPGVGERRARRRPDPRPRRTPARKDHDRRPGRPRGAGGEALVRQSR
jgi:hypothetical protein